MIILRICGLLAILVSIVPANPIMGDVDTTVTPSLDMSNLPSVQEVTTVIESGTFDPKATANESETKVTLAPLPLNEENAMAPKLDVKSGITSSSTMQKDIPNGITPVIAGMTDLFEVPTTTSIVMDSNVETTTNSMTLPPITPSTLSPTTPPTSPPTTLATQPPLTTSATESPKAPTTFAEVISTEHTMALTNTNELTNDISTQSGLTEPVVQDVKTMTPPVTEIKLNDVSVSTKSPISETLPVDASSDDDDDDLGSIVTIAPQVDLNSIIQTHPASIGASTDEINNNLEIIFTVPGEVNENSMQSHDEVDNVLSLSSNEDTTRIASSTDSKVNSDKNNHVKPLSAEAAPETKNDEHGKSFASSISSSFTVLVSMTVLYVIM